jgi:hypothetical protein
MSYANYCQDQAAACARRARLASSPEIVASCRTLELRWLKLAEQAQDTGGALGHESDPAATLFPLPEKPATYPVEYGKRAGELIARGAPSLSPRKRKMARVELYGREIAGAANLPPTGLLRISSSNCGAIATLSRFLHSATLPGGLLGRIPNAIKRMGGVS